MLKSHVLEAQSYNMPRQKISDEAFIDNARVISARLVVVYFLHQSRNEWVNWNGDTGNIRRPVGSVKGAIDEAYETAEKNRAPGTVFGMQDSVGIELICNTGTLLLAEQFTDSPFGSCVTALDFGGDLGALRTVVHHLPKRPFIGKRCFVGSERPDFQAFAATTTLFKRSARAGGRQNGLGWSAKPYQPILNDAVRIVALINASVTSAASVSKDSAGKGVAATKAQGTNATPATQLPANEAVAAPVKPQPKVQALDFAEEGDSQSSSSIVISTPEDPVLALEKPVDPPPLLLESTVREQLTSARIGQGLYRKRLEEIETRCRMTGLSELAHLRASHIKPWRVCTDAEKLDGNNGLLLSPHVDHLFDQGYISFSDTGDLLVSTSLKPSVLILWKLAEKANVGIFNPAQRSYLAYHRQNIFRQD